MPPRAPRAARIAPLLLALFAPGVANAASAVVTPLVAKGLDAKIAGNVTGLVSSELDFSGAYDTVTELSTAPAGLNEKCVASTSCLQGIAKASGVDAVLTGIVSAGGSGLQVQLVLYDATKNAIKSKQTFDVASDPSALANNAGKWVKAIVSGAPAAAAVAAEAPPSFSSEDEEDDFAFESAPKAAPSKSGSTSKSTSTAKASDVPTNTRMTTKAAPRALEDDAPADDDFEFEKEDPKVAAAAKAKAEAEAKAKAEAAAKAKSEAEARAKAEAAAKAKAEAEAKARAAAEVAARAEAERLAREEEEEEERQREEARAQAEAARRARDAAASAKSSTKSAAPAPEEDEGDDFEFGSSAGLIAIEADSEDEDELEDAPPARSSSRSSSSSTSKSSSGSSSASKASTSKSSSASTRAPVARDLDEDEPVEDDEDLVDLDEEEDEAPRTRKSFDEDEEEAPRSSSRSRTSSFDEDEDDDRSSRSSSSSRSTSGSSRSSSSGSSSSRFDDLDGPRRSTATIESDEAPSVSFAGRVGYSRYYEFNFITYGAELAIPVAPVVQILVGLEGFSTQRQLSEQVVKQLAEEADVDPAEINASPWNTILPFNVGVVYKNASKSVRPYVGLDFTLTPYTETFDLAVGARARAGADFMVADNFGLNLNLSAGLMWGEKLGDTQPGIEDMGLIPQISGGTVFQF